MKKVYYIIGIIVVIVLLAIVVSKRKKSAYSVVSVEVKNRTISKEITASGTLEALNTIDVGTQVSGIISKVYVDYNDHVKKGQIIAEIDKTTLISTIQDAQANVMKCQVQVDKTKNDWERNKILLEQKSVSKVDYDQSWYDYQTAIANLKSAQANLAKAQTSLDYATIISPVDGVILSRKVDQGQTVAASFNTPTLFSIAQDLTKMRVLADVDEADIGQVKVDQDVHFTVDAYTDIQFKGKIKQIRFEPKTTQNVVTYTVVVEVPNDDYKLMPGMTANLSIIVGQKIDVMSVEQYALQFVPDEKMIKLANLKFKKGGFSKMNPGNNNYQNKEVHHKILWKLERDSIIPVPVTLGISDGSFNEISGNIHSGDRIVSEIKLNTGVDNSSANAQNPFMPKFPKRK